MADSDIIVSLHLVILFISMVQCFCATTNDLAYFSETSMTTLIYTQSFMIYFIGILFVLFNGFVIDSS
jgi:hypothetical protein